MDVLTFLILFLFGGIIYAGIHFVDNKIRDWAEKRKVPRQGGGYVGEDDFEKGIRPHERQ